MSEVQRYSIKDGWLVADESGKVVSYEAYAALQQKLDAVLAENARMLSDYREIPEMRRIGAPLTPATDAILNEVRAEGALAASAKIHKAIHAFKDVHFGAVKECADIAEMVADELRTGSKEGGV